MRIKKELIKRQVGGETILVPVGKTVYESNGLFILNELGDFLWDRIPQADGPQALVEAVCAEYDVTPEVADRDIREFLATLEKMNIL